MSKPGKIPVKEFDYFLPPELISQQPIKPRDSARLLILDRKSGRVEHKKFYDLVDYLQSGDVLVLNDSQVIPARLIGHKETGGKVEVFLLNVIARSETVLAKARKQPRFMPWDCFAPSGLAMTASNYWHCLIGGKIKAGQRVIFTSGVTATIIEKSDEQTWLVKFNVSDKKLFAIGQTPTPPYIKCRDGACPVSTEDYQTIYAKIAGSVAAPTAGLHFTESLIAKLKKQGIKIEYITLHVGLGTFAPVKVDYIQNHKMHSELAILDKSTAERLNRAKKSGRRIIAVGTTSARALEAFAVETGYAPSLQAKSDWVNIFIYPGYKFKFVDAIITNFHLPQSTLLMLVGAFAGTKLTRTAYREAIKKKYKFYSFGDAMFIV